MSGGRPLRFIGVTLTGWIAMRTVALWPPIVPLREVTRHLATAQSFAADARWSPKLPMRRRRSSGQPRREPVRRNAARRSPPLAPVAPDAIVPAEGASDTQPATPTIRMVPPPTAPTPLAAAPRRFAGSAWLIARGGGTATLLGGQLGASQAGVRLTYTLDDRHRVALAGRIAAPLHGRGREAAIGIDWQPTAMPLHIVAEQRFLIDGGRGGPTMSVIGGLGPRPFARGLVVEAYGQAGAIARGHVDGFADGLIRVSHPLPSLGRARFDIGAGTWGGAQRGASRLDVGPSAGLRLPIGSTSVRLTADWRQRVAGRARPGSGPALSIGTDF